MVFIALNLSARKLKFVRYIFKQIGLFERPGVCLESITAATTSIILRIPLPTFGVIIQAVLA